MSKARCRQCQKIMSHVEFDQHNCPAHVGDPKDGESWNDYVVRSDKFSADWRKKQQAKK